MTKQKNMIPLYVTAFSISSPIIKKTHKKCQVKHNNIFVVMYLIISTE